MNISEKLKLVDKKYFLSKIRLENIVLFNNLQGKRFYVAGPSSMLKKT